MNLGSLPLSLGRSQDLGDLQRVQLQVIVDSRSNFPFYSVKTRAVQETTEVQTANLW